MARKSRGFSIVELMVALVLGAGVTLGIISMFSNTQESGAVLQGQARVQDNARYAIDFVGRSLRMSGFLGCVSRPDALRSALNGEFDNAPFSAAMQLLTQGFDGGNGGARAWSPDLTTMPRLVAGTANADLVAPGTDVLVVRQVASESRLAVAQVNSTSNLTMRMPAVPADFAVGDFALVSDCTKATLFQITGAAAAGGNYVLQHGAGGAAAPGNATASLPGFNEAASVYGTDASVFTVRTTVYYVAPGAGTNNRDDAPMSLWRKIGDDAAVELVEGVRDMEVTYGVDTDDDGTPNRYLAPNLVVDPDTIVTVRVRFTTDSVDEIPGGDGVITRDFETTVAVRNRLS